MIYMGVIWSHLYLSYPWAPEKGHKSYPTSFPLRGWRLPFGPFLQYQIFKPHYLGMQQWIGLPLPWA